MLSPDSVKEKQYLFCIFVTMSRVRSAASKRFACGRTIDGKTTIRLVNVSY